MKPCTFVFWFSVVAIIFAGAEQSPGLPQYVEKEAGLKIFPKKSETVRNLYPTALSPNNTQCVCGKDRNNAGWTAIVRFNSSEFKVEMPCFGIIIAHNLVVTSEKCLRRAGIRMNTYDDWQLSLNVTTVTFKISDLETDELEKRVYKVKNITNNAAAIDASSGLRLSAEDIALVVVDGDLFETIEDTDTDDKPYLDHFKIPVCIPKRNEENVDVLKKDVLHRFGQYFGLVGGFPYATEVEYRWLHNLPILDGDSCDEEGHFGNFSDMGALCTRSVLSLPTIEGGHLLTSNFGKHKGNKLAYSLETEQTFLVGICSETQKRPRGKRISYAYFANVMQNIDFIEKVANEHGSMWCETPDFADTTKATADELTLDEWPWETQPAAERSETLDCACGLQAGSESITQNGDSKDDELHQHVEWAAKIYLFWSRKTKAIETHTRAHCIGSIINDRVIVTSADCVDEYVSIKNQNGAWRELVNSYKIAISSSQLDSNNSDIKMVAIENIIVHPAYHPIMNDFFQTNFQLALLILEEPLVFAPGTTKSANYQNDIRPICLPKFNEKINIKNGTKLTAWERGTSKETEDVFMKMEYVTAESTRECARHDAADEWETLFCRRVSNKDKRNLLAGAPNVYLKNNGKYYQVGVDFKERGIYWDYDVSAEGNDTSAKYMIASVDLQQFIPFIEYHSNANNAEWCKE